MTPASFPLFTTELSNVMQIYIYIYIYIDTIIHEDTYPLHCYRSESIFLCIHVKQNVYDMFSTVMWYNFKEVVVQYKMVSAEFLNTFDRHKSVTRSERDFCGSRVFYKVNILKIGTQKTRFINLRVISVFHFLLCSMKPQRRFGMRVLRVWP